MDLLTIDLWWPTAVVAIAGLLYLYLKWPHSYWRKKGVPYVEPSIPFGNYKDHFMGKKSFGPLYADIYRKLRGHMYGGIYKMRQPVLLLRDPELIRTVLVKDFSSFQDNDFTVSVDVDPLFGRNPFVLKGNIWKETRSKLTSAFTAGKLKLIFPLIQEVCKAMLDHLEQHEETGRMREAKQLCTKYTADAVSSCAFGIQQNSFQNPDSEFRCMGMKFLETTVWRNLGETLIILIPSLAKILRISFTPKDVTHFFRRVIKEAVTFRQKNGVERKDFLQMLMQLKNASAADNANSKLPWYKKFTDEDVAAQAVTFFLDGYETSSTALALTLYDLAMNPDVQSRLREEIDAALESSGGDITFEMINGLAYLDMVVCESLRVQPPLPYINRLCTKPYQLPTPSGGTVNVEVGIPTVIPTLGLHYDPAYFPEPHRYNPENFSEENKQSRPRYVFLPFGEGPRICLGMRFALTQNKTCIVSILSKYEIRTCGKTPQKISPHPGSFLFVPEQEIWLEFVRRHDK